MSSTKFGKPKVLTRRQSSGGSTGTPTSNRSMGGPTPATAVRRNEDSDDEEHLGLFPRSQAGPYDNDEEGSDAEDPSTKKRAKKRAKSVPPSKNKKKKDVKDASRTPLFSGARPPMRVPMPSVRTFHGIKQGREKSCVPSGSPCQKSFCTPSRKVLSPVGRQTQSSSNSSSPPALSSTGRLGGTAIPENIRQLLTPDLADALVDLVEGKKGTKKKEDPREQLGSKHERGFLAMSVVLVSDSFVGGAQQRRASVLTNPWMMAAAQASSFAANTTEKEFTDWLRKAMHGARHKMYVSGRNAIASVVGHLASERAKKAEGPDLSTVMWNDLITDVFAIPQDSIILESFTNVLFRPYVDSHEGSYGQPLHLSDIVGSMDDMKCDLLQTVLKPVVLAAVCAMQASSPITTDFSWERARAFAESWVTTPNGGHARDNSYETSYGRTFWRSLFFFATQGERRLGLLKSLSPAKVTTSLANEALLPYLAGQAELHEEADGQGIGGDVNDDEDQHSVVDEEIEYDD